MDILVEPWKLIATIASILIVSVASFATNYYMTKRRLKLLEAEKDLEEELEDPRTPEELFEEKLINEEYDEALEIARTHGLDTDLVYQQQWNKSDVTIETIDGFLSRVVDRRWCLQECLERIPETIEVIRCLLKFGISLTDSANLDFDTDENFYNLNSDQRQLVLCRKRLLQYYDRLETFENILGGPSNSQRCFDSSVYEKFRRLELLESCVEFAREGHHKAVSTMFTFHGAQTLEHWLPVLSQIPEVISPFCYRNLLPESGLSENDEDVYPWEEIKLRNEDWSEKMLPDPPEDYPEIFYAQSPHLTEFRTKSLTKSLISKWFCNRSRQIESCTSLICNSLQLIQLGIERNLPNLAHLHSRLETFATLVYDCLPRSDQQVDLTFDQFSKLSSDEIVKLLMTGSQKDSKTFISCLRSSLLPYLNKYDARHVSGRCQGPLENFLVECARSNLRLVRAVFENSIIESKDESDSYEFEPIITNIEDLLRLAIRCISECEDENFLSDAFSIVECLPQRTDADPLEIKTLQDQIDEIENNLAVIELFDKHGCKIIMKGLKSSQETSSDARRLFTELMRKSSKRSEFDVTEGSHWTQLLQDALQIRTDCFSNIISEIQIQEIFIKTLLAHGREGNFELAYSMFQKLAPNDIIQLVLECSRDFVNSASSASDKSVLLAKKCIKLLPSETISLNPDVQEESDFISALQIIGEYWKLSLLPVQMRLMEQPKLQLLMLLLKENPIYKHVSKVLEVVRLMRICNEMELKEREATVLIMLGEAALDDDDLRSCGNICQQIMSEEIGDGWKLCLELANQTRDNNLALDLLSFSLTYCEDETGDRLYQILNMIDVTQREQEKLEPSPASTVLKSAQLVTGEVSKKAQHLTSWLLPKLKVSKTTDVKEVETPEEELNESNVMEMGTDDSGWDFE